MFMASENCLQASRGAVTPSSWDVAARASAPCTSHVGCGDRSAHRKAARQLGEIHVEEDRMAERWSDARCIFGRRVVRGERCGFGPGRGGLLQDGRRAAGL